jgi:hypothetical protein
MAEIAVVSIIKTRRTIEDFELRLFIRHPLIAVTYETGICGN